LNIQEALNQVAQEVSNCEKCNLHYSRKLAVPGEGPADAKIMFIGEGPGFYENEQGRPFVGPSGKYLDELLASIKMKRVEVFIGNVVKCRPPGNRDPLPEELAACRDYLERQIQAMNPSVIVTLGRYSMTHFLPNAKISEIHGQAITVKGRLIVAMYHPAAALHQKSLKTTIEDDFARLPQLIAKHRNGVRERQQTAAYATNQASAGQLNGAKEPLKPEVFIRQTDLFAAKPNDSQQMSSSAALDITPDNGDKEHPDDEEHRGDEGEQCMPGGHTLPDAEITETAAEKKQPKQLSLF
jgi:uracil-DNA glycosylase